MNVVIPWNEWQKDTVVPQFTYSIDLGYGHEAYTYEVSVGFPELKPLTEAERIRYRLPKEKGLPEWPVLDTHRAVTAKRGQMDVRLVPIIWRDGRYQRMENLDFIVKKTLRAQRSRQLYAAENRYAAHSVLDTGRWVKVRVTASGIHELTHQQLRSMGFKDPAQVRLYGYGGNALHEYEVHQWKDDLNEVPLWRESDRIFFYAEGPVKWTVDAKGTFTHSNNPYTSYGYYFLTEDAEVKPMPFPKEAPQEGAVQWEVKTTPAHALYEVDGYSYKNSGRRFYDSYDFANGPRKSYAFDLPGIVVDKDAHIEVAFSHDAPMGTRLSVQIGERDLGYISLPANGFYSEGAEVARSFTAKMSEKEQITLLHHRNAGVMGRLDYIRISYPRHLQLDVPALDIYALQEGVSRYTCVTDEAPVVWRIADAAQPTQMVTTMKEQGCEFVAKSSVGEHFVVFNPKAKFPSPIAVGEIKNQDLHATPAVDYVIIVPASGKLQAEAERLAEAHRRMSGLRVQVVRADEIYNEFSSGTPDATAYRRYMKMLYDRARTPEDAPKYLLLFGDGAWDNRMVLPTWKNANPDDYLLCFESENSMSNTVSYVMEDYYGLLDDGEGQKLTLDKVDIGVGRFPVTTVSQARSMVDKCIAYMENKQAGAWKNAIYMLGDDGDNNQHMQDAEFVTRMLEREYPEYATQRIYWDTYPMEVSATNNSYPTVRKRLMDIFSEGALMINYNGHGNANVLSHELVISKGDMETIKSDRLPVWVTASCDVSPFDDSQTSLGENGVLNPKGGALAFFTTTRTVFSSQNRRINYFFSKYLFGRDSQGKRYRMGDAVRLAKCSLIDTTADSLQDKSSNKLHYVLLGDPALLIGNADYRMVVDEINDRKTGTQSQQVLHAGEVVRVKGRVTDGAGSVVPDFKGLLHAKVLDNKEQVFCRNNAGSADTPFSYVERIKTLFVGTDSVRNGHFSFEFRVPMDINYSMKSGLINLYAVDSAYTREAQGVYDKFLLGGTADSLHNEGEGPTVNVYLNTPDFVTGDKVNETPLLLVTLTDEDGINTVGNGIGHDLVAIVDGKEVHNLNAYYRAEAGSYRSGTIAYSLPELTDGKHTLMFRAWDTMNNSTTVTIEFVVQHGLKPQVLNISSTQNPARTATTFVVMHDRPETEVKVMVEVFDLSGRILWRSVENAVTVDQRYMLDWDLCGDSGQPLSSGVYLYRATVSSASGSSSSRASKLTILRK